MLQPALYESNKQTQLRLLPLSSASADRAGVSTPHDPTLPFLTDLRICYAGTEEVLPSYDAVRLPSYTTSQSQHMLQAEPVSDGRIIRLLRIRTQLVRNGMGALDLEAEDLQRQNLQWQ